MMKLVICLFLSLTSLAQPTKQVTLPEDQIEESFDEEVNISDVEIRQMYKLGLRALKQKYGLLAIEEFLRCTHLKPKNPDCHWELGWAYFLEHDYAKAKLAWEKVKQLQPQREGLNTVLERIQLHYKTSLNSKATRKKAPPSFRSPKQKKTPFLRIHAVGDVMLGTSYPKNQLPPEDVQPLSMVKDLFNGSHIRFANYEGTLCDQEIEALKCQGKTTCYAFRTPTSFGQQLKDVGFNLINLANNHIFDFGHECRDETEKTLSQLGIFSSGKSESVARFEINGQQISLLGFHSSGHTNSSLDFELVTKMVSEEKKQNRIVIVGFHGGAEGIKALHTPNSVEMYMGENRGEVIRFARTAVDAGADVVLGSGPHVVRGIEIYKNRLIAYSLGNFATYKTFNLWGFNSVSLILELDIEADGKLSAGRIIPIRQIEHGVPIYDHSKESIDLIRYLNNSDFKEYGAIIAQDGTFGTRADLQRLLKTRKPKTK